MEIEKKEPWWKSFGKLPWQRRHSHHAPIECNCWTPPSQSRAPFAKSLALLSLKWHYTPWACSPLQTWACRWGWDLSRHRSLSLFCELAESTRSKESSVQQPSGPESGGLQGSQGWILEPPSSFILASLSWTLDRTSRIVFALTMARCGEFSAPNQCPCSGRWENDWDSFS